MPERMKIFHEFSFHGMIILPDKLAKSTSYPYRFSQPGHIVHVAAQVAALRNISIDEVLEANKRNIGEIYGIAIKI